jgi:hypothetical protein
MKKFDKLITDHLLYYSSERREPGIGVYTDPETG